jgi:hypothetical protein
MFTRVNLLIISSRPAAMQPTQHVSTSLTCAVISTCRSGFVGIRAVRTLCRTASIAADVDMRVVNVAGPASAVNRQTAGLLAACKNPLHLHTPCAGYRRFRHYLHFVF